MTALQVGSSDVLKVVSVYQGLVWTDNMEDKTEFFFFPQSLALSFEKKDSRFCDLKNQKALQQGVSIHALHTILFATTDRVIQNKEGV